METEQGQIIEVSGWPTNVHDEGQGPPVLLIHGSGPGSMAWTNWRTIAPELARQFRVIAPDLLGFGHTTKPPGTRYTRSLWTQHLLAVLDALAVPQADVVGFSLGGGLALRLASRRPERVGRIVLIGSLGLDFPLTAGLDTVWGYTPSEAGMRRVLEALIHDRGLITDELVRMRYETTLRPGYQEVFQAMFPPPRQESIAAFALEDDALRAITAETLILHGREDQVVPAEIGWRLHGLLERSELHVFGHCGHFVQVERAAGAGGQIREFLSRRG